MTLFGCNVRSLKTNRALTCKFWSWRARHAKGTRNQVRTGLQVRCSSSSCPMKAWNAAFGVAEMWQLTTPFDVSTVPHIVLLQLLHSFCQVQPGQQVRLVFASNPVRLITSSCAMLLGLPGVFFHPVFLHSPSPSF